MHTNLETIVTNFNEARGGDDNSKALQGTSDIGKVKRAVYSAVVLVVTCTGCVTMLQILKVLNVHNDSLSFIESKSRCVLLLA